MDKEELQKKINELNEQLKNSSLSGTERMKLQHEKTKLQALLYADDSEDENEETKEREEKIDPRIQLCNNESDQIGNKIKNFNDIKMVVLPNLQTIYCYTKEDISHMLNPGADQLYYWRQHPTKRFCCHIPEKKIYKLGYVGLYLDDSASYLKTYKIVRLVLKEKALIGSDLTGGRSAVSAIHGQEHDIYSVIPLDPVKIFPLMERIKEIMSKNIEISNDPKYIEAKNELNNLIRLKNNLSAQIEQKKDAETDKYRKDFIEGDERDVNTFRKLLLRFIISNEENVHVSALLNNFFTYYNWMPFREHKFSDSDIYNFIRYTKDNGIWSEIIGQMEKRMDTSDFVYKTIDNEQRLLDEVEHKIADIQKILEPYAQEYNQKRKLRLEEGQTLLKECEIDPTTYLQSIVRTVLAKDKEHRYEGVKDDLFTQNDIEIQSVSANSFGIPFIGAKKCSSNAYNPCLPTSLNINTDISAFKQYYRQNSVLNEIYDYMFQNNMIVAGGYPCAILRKGPDNYYVNSKDIDIFFYDTTPEKAMESIYNIESALNKKFGKLSTTKTKNTITFIYLCERKEVRRGRTVKMEKFPITLQFILRIYNTKSEILHGFDFGSAAVGFDGDNVLFTSLSKFAYEYGCNIIDTTRRSTTYEHRLLKYASVGFNILMPDFDLEKLRNEIERYKKERYGDHTEVLFPVMFSFPIKYNVESIEGYAINGKLCGSTNYSLTESDYKTSDRIVIRNIIRKNYSDMSIGSADRMNKDLKNLLTNETLKQNIKSYLATLKSEYRVAINRNFLCSQLKRIKKISYLADYLPEPDVLYKIVETANLEEFKEELTRQFNIAVKNIQSIPESVLQIEWMTKNAMTQLTSSFNPIIKEPKDWYGIYYKYNEKFWNLKISDNSSSSSSGGRSGKDEAL